MAEACCVAVSQQRHFTDSAVEQQLASSCWCCCVWTQTCWHLTMIDTMIHRLMYAIIGLVSTDQAVEAVLLDKRTCQSGASGRTQQLLHFAPMQRRKGYSQTADKKQLPVAICHSCCCFVTLPQQDICRKSCDIERNRHGKSHIQAQAAPTKQVQSCPMRKQGAVVNSTSVCNLTVTSRRKSSMQLKSWLMYWGSLRIMPGALSRASHSVTRNSAASCLIPSGN